MRVRLQRLLWLLLGLASGLASPLAVLSLVLLFNPYAILLSGTFEITNSLPDTVHVTPMARLAMASGEERWIVVHQLAVPFLGAPALTQAKHPVAPGSTRSFRANFDDASLGAIAVATAAAPDQAMVVDRAALSGGCCYPPRDPRIVIAAKDLVTAAPQMLEAVERAERSSGDLAAWWVIVVVGIAAPVLFFLSLRRYRALSRAA